MIDSRNGKPGYLQLLFYNFPAYLDYAVLSQGKGIIRNKEKGGPFSIELLQLFYEVFGGMEPDLSSPEFRGTAKGTVGRTAPRGDQVLKFKIF